MTGDVFRTFRKEIFRDTLSTEDPKVTTVTLKGQITIPTRLRNLIGLEKGMS